VEEKLKRAMSRKLIIFFFIMICYRIIFDFLAIFLSKEVNSTKEFT